MSFFDDFLPSIPIVGPLTDSLFGGEGAAGDTYRSRIEMYQKLMGELPTYKPINTREAVLASAGPANDIARGREESAIQDEAVRTGGAATSGNVLAARESGRQGSMNRLAQVGYQANLDNTQMLNDFNQRNMMNKLAITGGESSGAAQYGDYQERLNYARRQNLAGMWNQLTGTDLLKKLLSKGGTSQGGSDSTYSSPFSSGYGDYGDLAMGGL